MEFKFLSVLALFLLAFVGINGSSEEEQYWKSVWPNTPIPKALSDLLLSDRETTNMPIKSQEENQYWTIFFEHDLYPGKTMNLGIQKPSYIRSLKSPTHLPFNKVSQIFRTRKWLGETPEKDNQPFELTIKSDKATEIETKIPKQPLGVCMWWYKQKIDRTNPTFESSVCDKEETTEENQPFGFSVWDKKEIKKENQPFGFWIWDRKEAKKENQPFGFSVWDKKEMEKENQPFGSWAWDRKETKKEDQPFGFSVWDKKEIEKENQPFGSWAWDRKETKKDNQPFGFSVWDKKEIEKENQPFGFWIWDRKEAKKEDQPFEFSVGDKKEIEKENQPFGSWAWDRKETKKENQPFVKDTQKESEHFVAHTLDEKEAHILNNYCRTPSAIGEDKHCALSLKSMMDFAISKLGKNIKVMSSSLVQNQDKYVVEEVNKIGEQAVMCHRLNFKKVVFYCHAVNATTTYMVPLVTSDGTKSKALTICHHDTRGMNPSVFYEVLNAKPGTVPVCHFIGNKAIAWVPDVSESDGHPCVI